MRVLVLQHIACEPPGVFEDVLVERGHELVRVELDEGESLPGDDFDAIVAMGGPMSVNDEGEHPWLVAEKALIAGHVRAGRPFWGSCLGAQLLAASLGARVYAGPAPEVGVLAVDLTEAGKADPVLGSLPPRVETLQWHGDTFDLPDGGVLLASSPAYPHQAFRVEIPGPEPSVAYAVQFHVEVTQAMGEEWASVPAYAEYADRVLGPGGSDRLLQEFRVRSPLMQDHARALFERWCNLAEA
jgi:GMP synthase-like glutamine amidotransferase